MLYNPCPSGLQISRTIILFPGPINFSTVSGSEVTRGEEEPDDYTESLFPFTEDSGPRYVESSLLRGREDTSGDRVNFGE